MTVTDPPLPPTTVKPASTVLAARVTVSGAAVTGTTVSVVRRSIVVDRLTTTKALAQSIVEIWWRPAGSTWRKLTTRRVDATGHATYRFTATRDAAYRWRFAGSTTQAGAWSKVVAIRVR